MTALYVASQNGHVEVVNILLQNGAHVDVQNEVRKFTYELLTGSETVCITRTLLRHLYWIECFDFHVQDKSTPLMIVSQYGHVDVVNVLLQHGASVCLQNKVRL